MKTQDKSTPKQCPTSTCSVRDFLAKASALRENDSDSMICEELSSLKLPELLKKNGLHFFYWRTSRGCYRMTAAGHLKPSSPRLRSWGILSNAYLLSRRGVDQDVVSAFAHKGMVYESAKYHNAVFVGFGTDGKAAHANLRGTGSESTFKGNVPGSRPEHSFHWTGSDEKLYLFEAPIDMLSYISMNKDGWQNHSYAACCGVSDRVMFQMLKDNPNITTVCLCLDNDEAGWQAEKRMSEKLSDRGIRTEILVPSHKDWNEDLLNLQESEEENECRELQL